MKNDRLFQILYILLGKHQVTAPELARQLEVLVRTVYRDVDALSMAGIPICTVAGKGGGISLMSGYTFDKALLSDKEQDQVLFALQSLQAAGQGMDTQDLMDQFHHPLISATISDFCTKESRAVSFIVSYENFSSGDGGIFHGGSRAMAFRMKRRYEELGGNFHVSSP